MEKFGIALLPHKKEHRAPFGHPENYYRVSKIIERFENDDSLTRIQSKSISIEQIEKVHTNSLLENLNRLVESRITSVDPDTYLSSKSLQAAFEVAGSLCSAVDSAFNADLQKSFIVGRPPGHHAESNRSMGFCLINHVAIGAQYAINNSDCNKVCIYDFDVHHGNGTQEIFYDRDDVLYISSHQYPFYPGTGSEKEQGIEKGAGYTLNIPLSAGTDDETYIKLFDAKIAPAIIEYEPDLIIVSAGFDGHKLDPLGGFNLTGQCYRYIGLQLKEISNNICNDRVVSFMEGGYSSDGNVDGVMSYIEGLRNGK